MTTQVYYINLDHRKDRRDHIEKTLAAAGFTGERFPAIRNDECGAIGCSYSHAHVLEQFLKTDKEFCIVLEDDFTFVNPGEAKTRIQHLLECADTWDLVMLAGKAISTEECKDPSIRRVIDAQTTSGYLLKRSFAPTLLKNYLEGVSQQDVYVKKHKKPSHPYCLDIHWKQLQPISKWFICEPKLGFQLVSYSDIEKRVVDYKC